ncbi:Six-hairpin glycosidase [Aspergillus karnatakaensis]|uniref:Six-hairpin glycosidase n=1 Tax=Aspergillus karnatakaensis TaxID=1810916 RepID=UPI003CCD813D
MALEFDRSWIWHPQFNESERGTAGRFLHFRRIFHIDTEGLPPSLKLYVTADTRYKLYVNHQLVGFGPVKGDENLWFYDEVDIAPFLNPGRNIIGVHVLRFFHATTYAPSFPRLPSGGLRIQPRECDGFYKTELATSEKWETAIDWFTTLRVDEPEDHFLHIYEKADPTGEPLQWVPAEVLEYKISTGNSTPWKLSPRLIPPLRVERSAQITAIHNVDSAFSSDTWRASLCSEHTASDRHGLLLPAGTQHALELEVPHHTTAFIRIRFKRPALAGSILRVKYSESYEDEPESVPWTRRKEDRRDTTKRLYGPEDIYHFHGPLSSPNPGYHPDEETQEIFTPFHFRTFRFMGLNISVHPSSDLVVKSIEIETVTYPLEIHASFKAEPDSDSTQLWTTSIRTLQNCMHDCYEDCPFYEQLQYALDTRSSALFTYYLSGDDRLARQAITQLHSSFNAHVGLTKSRAPSHRAQYIPTFSLFWICMVADHFLFFADGDFTSRFLPVIDAVLWYFQSRIDRRYGLTRTFPSTSTSTSTEPGPGPGSGNGTGIWPFIDWTPQWKPHGIPPAVQKTGISTFVNEVYAYTLELAAQLATALNQAPLASAYHCRAEKINHALRQHCFTGTFFTDSLASQASERADSDTNRSIDMDISQHCQTWAVLCAAIPDRKSQRRLMSASMGLSATGAITQESTAMSFYTLRALSRASEAETDAESLYNTSYTNFWFPWQAQLTQNCTTWIEDSVSQRSDCHAWGSIPIFEFLAEVVGVKPAGPGWDVIEFCPRVGLYECVEARVPLGGGNGRIRGVVDVKWNRMEDSRGGTRVCLRVQGEDVAGIRINVSVSGKRMIHENCVDGLEIILRE